MNPSRRKGGPRGIDPGKLIETAIQDGLSEDKSGIDHTPVYKKLAPITEPQYARMMRLWFAYLEKYPASDPRDMVTMKHFAEVVARSTGARLDQKLKRPTVKSIRVKIRSFMSAWERETQQPIPKHVHDSMAPDLVCMVGWKDGEPDIKMGFKRDVAKGMQDTPKKPKHPLYERMTPTPPLFANSIMFLLAIFVSHNAFRDLKRIEDVLQVRPPPKEKYRILDWADGVLNDPIFPEMCRTGPTSKAKNKDAWGHQCSDWAKRANFIGGMGLHAARREELIKVDEDSGYSLGQVMKFAGHRSSKTLVGHYLADMSNVDGAAAFLGLEPRRDVTEDFRSASMAKLLEELKQGGDYTGLREEIAHLSVQIDGASTKEEREELKVQQQGLYYQQRKLRNEEGEKYKRGQKRDYNTQSVADDRGDWRRSYFARVVRHMIPERDRLADTLARAVPLRSSEGFSALQDLISLLTNDSRVAYHSVFQPTNGRCPVKTCSMEIEELPVQDRWGHIYKCSKHDLKQRHGFSNIPNPGAATKRRRSEDKKEGKSSNAVKAKKPRIRANKCFEPRAHAASTQSRRPKDGIDRKFISLLQSDYAKDGGSSAKEDGSNTDALVSSMSGIQETPQLEENFRPALITEPSATALDPFTDAGVLDVSAHADIASSIDRSAQPSSGKPVLISSSSFPEPVNPELESMLLAPPTSCLPTNTASLRNEVEPLLRQEGGPEGYREIWDVEELLAKWCKGRATWYLVKWKGFPHEDNTWEKRKDISPDLVQSFESSYKGNFSGAK
nr:Unknown function [Thelonectria discophora]